MKAKAILLIGGTGERFGSLTPKQFHLLSGKKVYLHTLQKFIDSQRFEEIIIVAPKPWLEEVQKEVKVRVIAGGATRQESSYLGLKACGPDTDIVVIHDGVRPFVTREIIEANIKGAIEEGAVDTCIPSADTLIRKTGNEIIEIPDRTDFLRGQTPQSFQYKIILEAHQKTKKTNASDDCQLVMDLGSRIKIVEGHESNIKITTELDLFIAEQLFRQTSSMSAPGIASLAGKRYAIAGGTGGIGSALQILLEKEGSEVVSISPTSPNYPADLSSRNIAHRVFTQVGEIDGLINSFGRFHLGDMQDMSEETIEKIVSVNLTALIFACKYVKVKNRGHIVNIASSSFSKGRKGFAVYSAAKAAVVNFTQGFSEERPDLLINAIIPQRTNTPMRRDHFPHEDPESLLAPEAVAEAIVDLLKQDAVTGTIIEVKKSNIVN